MTRVAQTRPQNCDIVDSIWRLQSRRLRSFSFACLEALNCAPRTGEMLASTTANRSAVALGPRKRQDDASGTVTNRSLLCDGDAH